MINHLLTELLASAVDALRANARVRTLVIVVTSTLFVVSAIAYLGRAYWIEPVHMVIGDVGPIAIMASGGALLVALASFTKYQFAARELGEELESLRDARREIRKRLEHAASEAKPEETVLDTIQLSLNQIAEYYAINKSQAVSSFRFSVFAMVAGLATLVGAIWFAFFRESPDKQLGFITGVSGVLIQFISGAYFWMHQKSLSQLNYFYDKLVKMQDTMLAIQLSESLPEEQKHAIKKQLITTLIARSSAALPSSLLISQEEGAANAAVPIGG